MRKLENLNKAEAREGKELIEQLKEGDVQALSKIIEIYFNDNGEIKIENMEFSDDIKCLNLSGIKMKGVVVQGGHESGDIHQEGHKNNGAIYQGFHKNNGYIAQQNHRNGTDIGQSNHENGGDVTQIAHKNGGRIVQSDIKED